MPPVAASALTYEVSCERKALVPPAALSAVIAELKTHPAAFRPQHPPRRVHSLYLDGPDLPCHRAHRDGVFRRAKLRLRCYGEGPQARAQAHLEVKAKEGSLRRKAQIAVEPPGVPTGRARDLIPALLGRIGSAPDALRVLLAGLAPSVETCYRRRYLVSADGRFRLTIDEDLAYRDARFELRADERLFLDVPEAVIELKYYPTWEQAAADLIAGLPFRLCAYSKYQEAVRRLIS